MRLDELKPAPGSRRQRKRVGRGISAGQGKTAGRGQKGQGSRSSVDIPHSFEGGQMPLAQRLPKLRGFTPPHRREYVEVNITKLNRFEAGTEVNPELLEQVGLVKGHYDGVKILAAGQLKVALKVSAHRVSAHAKEAIEAAGGSVELLGPQPLTPEERAARAKAKAKKTSAKQAAAAERAEAAAEADEAEAKAEAQAAAEARAKSQEAGAGEEPAESAEREADASEPGAEASEPAAGAAEPPAENEAADTAATDTDEADSPEES
jgi:large subunit ribosomal protein L15